MKSLHASSCLLVWLCLSAFMLTEPVWAAPCTTATSECTEWVTLPESSSRLLVYSIYSLDARNEGITRGLIVVHGGGRNADGYFRDSLAAAFLAGGSRRLDRYLAAFRIEQWR